MDIKWEKLYARKNEYFIFEEEQVKGLFEEEIGRLNSYLRNVHVRDIEMKDSYLDFPDCKITFNIDKKSIVFIKEDKQGGLQRQAELIINSNNLIKLPQTEESFFTFDAKTISAVFQHLLIPKM